MNASATFQNVMQITTCKSETEFVGIFDERIEVMTDDCQMKAEPD